MSSFLRLPALFLAALPILQAASSPDFAIVATVGTQIGGKTLTSITTGLSINDLGTIVFQGEFPGGEGIFTPSQLLVATGDTVAGKQILFLRDILTGRVRPAINNNGTVLFDAIVSGGPFPALFTLSPNQLLSLPAGGGPGPGSLVAISAVAINDAGQISFRGEFPGGSTIYGLAGGQSAGFSFFRNGQSIVLYQVGALSQNNAGNIVFEGLSLNAHLSGIFTGGPTGEVLATTGDTISGHTLTALSHPVINDRGTVVFLGRYADGSGIFSPTREIISTGQKIDGKVITNLSGDLALDRKSKLAFIASCDGGSGLFSKSKLLLATGDTIDGKTLTALGGLVMNSLGQLAFIGSFSDGTTGIVTGNLKNTGNDQAIE